MTLFYPDVANVNWSSNNDVIGFLSQLSAEGFAGVAHKVSQGATFQDSYWPVALQWCQQNNLPIIGYHYLSTEDPGAQAANWQAAGGGTQAMFDWEDGGGDLNNFWAVVSAFNAIGVNVQLGYMPRWYLEGAGSGAGTDLSNLAANGILLVSSSYPGGSGYASDIYANAGGDTGQGFAPYDGATPSAWQFTDSATVAGFSVDVNAYLGSDINVLFGVTAPAPPPPVAPPSPPVTPVGTVTPPVPPVAPSYPWALPTDGSVLDPDCLQAVVDQFLGVS